MVRGHGQPAAETPAGEGPRRVLGAPDRGPAEPFSEEIEKKCRSWRSHSSGEQAGASTAPAQPRPRSANPSDSHEALEKEVGGHGWFSEASSPHQRLTSLHSC